MGTELTALAHLFSPTNATLNLGMFQQLVGGALATSGPYNYGEQEESPF